MSMEGHMTEKLQRLIEQAKKIKMTPEQREAQRRSFVYGNTKLENDCITKQLVNKVGDQLANGGSQ